jgi:aminomethyltransferase
MTVLSSDGGDLGVITSGTFSPTLKVGIGLALLSPQLADGDSVSVDIRGRPEPFVIVKPPFVTPGVRES